MKRSCFFASRKLLQSLFGLIPFGGGVRGINLPHVLTDPLKTYSSVVNWALPAMKGNQLLLKVRCPESRKPNPGH